MKTVLHKADSRGHASHGWLDSYHSFSFAQYYDAERIHFGALRVLNDDTVSGGMGFGKHPHDNMEIISIPLEGALEHQDNTGTKAVIRKGDVQIMSAGTGIAHSEKNASDSDPVKFLQIWIFPNQKNVAPRYDQKTFDDRPDNEFVNVVAPMDSEEEGVKIYQDAWFHLAKMTAGNALAYELRKPENGVYIFVLEGSVTVNGMKLERRDGLGVTEPNDLNFVASEEAEVLVMEVPV